MKIRKSIFIKIAAISFLLTIFWSASAFAQPNVTSFSGSLTNGSTITINGNSFGVNGPNILIFDDFESGTNGANIKIGAGSATIGEWTSVTYLTPTAPKYSNAHILSGNLAFRGDATLDSWGDGNGSCTAAYKCLNDVCGSSGPTTNDIFVSYWYYFPTTSDWPCLNNSLCGSKIVWITGSGTGDDDRTITDAPSSKSGIDNYFSMFGNNSIGVPSFSPALTMAKGKWYRFWAYLHGEGNANDHEEVWVASPSSEGNIAAAKRINRTTQIWNSTYNGFNRVMINGFNRFCNDCAESAPTFDDVYVAIGAGARARVEIGDAATYATSKNLTIATVTSWSDTSITATIQQGSFSNLNNAYLYVIDADGNVNTNGYLLSDGGGSNTPPPPSGSGGDSSASGGSGCGFVKDDGKGQGPLSSQPLELSMVLILLLLLIFIKLKKEVKITLKIIKLIKLLGTIAVSIIIFNLPASAQIININTWDSLPSDWIYISPQPSIDSLINTPDPSNALKIIFPIGFKDGYTPTLAGYVFPQQDEFYWGFWFKFSSNWTWNPVGNKITYIKLTNSKNNFFVAAMDNDHKLAMVNQPAWTNFGRFDSTTGYNPTIVDGQWYWLEMHMKINTPGVADGLFELWLDNKLVMKHTNVPYRSASESNISFHYVSLEPIWGGAVGLVKQKEEYVWYDYSVISTTPIGGGGDAPPPSDGGNTPPPSSGSGGDSGGGSGGGGGCGFVKDSISNRESKSQSGKVVDIGLMVLLVLALTAIVSLKKIKYFKGFLFLIIFLFPFSIANAATYYVDQNNAAASDSNTGTETLPWKTLTKAAKTVVAGDTVIVKAGKYVDLNGNMDAGWFNPANSGTASAPITYKSELRLAAILAPKATGVDPAMDIFKRSYIIIDGFKAEGMILIMGGDHITVQNCEVIYGSTIYQDPSLNWGIAIHSSSYNIVRNNYVHNMLNSGNTTHNTGGIMVFGTAGSTFSDYNIIENNLVDAGGGTVYSAYGQKAGSIHYNIWRNNIARNATTGFLGMGSTDVTRYSDYNEFYNNIIYDTKYAFELNHNSRWFKVHNNTAYNCTQFFSSANYPIELNNIGEQIWNNIIANCTSGYYWPNSDTSTSNTPLTEVMSLLSSANYNDFFNTPNIASWNWGQTSYTTLADWQNATSFDKNSLISDPLFVDASLKNFHLQTNSPVKGKGKNGEDIGAYATGNEVIGPDWQLTDGGGGGGGNTPPPSSGGSGGDSSASGGSGCGFVRDNNGKGQGAKGEGLALMVMLLITLAGIAIARKIQVKRRVVLSSALCIFQ